MNTHPVDPSGLARMVAQWFGTHDALDRQTFATLLELNTTRPSAAMPRTAPTIHRQKQKVKVHGSRNFRHWKPSEDEMLKKLAQQRANIHTIADAMRRNVGSVRQHMHKIGIRRQKLGYRNLKKG